MSTSPENKKMMESALKYLERGYNVIPVNPDKKPLVKWEPYQKNRVTQNDVRGWFGGSQPRNIGIVTGEISNLFVVDTDTQQSKEEVQNYLPESIITPIQKTPHDGMHFFFSHIDGFSNRARIAPGIDIRTTGGYIVVDPSVNGEGKRWEWLPGLSLLDVSPSPLPDALMYYIKEFAFGFYKEGKNYENDLSSNVVKMFTEGRRDEDLFHTANCLIKGGMEYEEASQVINILAQYCIPQFPISEAKDKVISALKRAQRKERNLTEEVREWILNESCRQSVVILSSDVVRSLHLSSREDEKHLSTIFRRLCEEGLIEKYGDKRGSYRIVVKDADEIDFMSVQERVLDIEWPFQIEKWVKILPKNIIIIAGEANAGKTAFLLNLCSLNMGKFKINYFSSEMGAMELRARLEKFEGNLVHWKEYINFRERASNFADVCKPNDLNIVDYLEVTDEFYKVGGMIAEIFNKLKKGVAIIALQKNKGTDLGLGGMRSIEKARLYLSMEPGKLKIVKGKNWASEHNPNGMEWRFKLIQGAKFITQYKEDE